MGPTGVPHPCLVKFCSIPGYQDQPPNTVCKYCLTCQDPPSPLVIKQALAISKNTMWKRWPQTGDICLLCSWAMSTPTFNSQHLSKTLSWSRLWWLLTCWIYWGTAALKALSFGRLLVAFSWWVLVGSCGLWSAGWLQAVSGSWHWIHSVGSQWLKLPVVPLVG